MAVLMYRVKYCHTMGWNEHIQGEYENYEDALKAKRDVEDSMYDAWIEEFIKTV